MGRIYQRKTLSVLIQIFSFVEQITFKSQLNFCQNSSEEPARIQNLEHNKLFCSLLRGLPAFLGTQNNSAANYNWMVEKDPATNFFFIFILLNPFKYFHFFLLKFLHVS